MLTCVFHILTCLICSFLSLLLTGEEVLAAVSSLLWLSAEYSLVIIIASCVCCAETWWLDCTNCSPCSFLVKHSGTGSLNKKKQEKQLNVCLCCVFSVDACEWKWAQWWSLWAKPQVSVWKVLTCCVGVNKKQLAAADHSDDHRHHRYVRTGLRFAVVW